MTKKVLIISGLDPSGNAGLLRDLEIAHTFPLETSASVTALTSQNLKNFLKTQTVTPAIFKSQLQSLVPLSQYHAIKIGMLGNEKLIEIFLSFLKRQKNPPIILDPVMESSTGGILLTKKGRQALWDKLLPRVSLWTPNLAEASYYFGKEIRNPAMMQKAAQFFWKTLRVPVLIKGGHAKQKKEKKGKVQDIFIDKKGETWFLFPRHKNKKRGTGCALASLIASFVAVGFPLREAVTQSRSVMQRWLHG